VDACQGGLYDLYRICIRNRAAGNFPSVRLAEKVSSRPSSQVTDQVSGKTDPDANGRGPWGSKKGIMINVTTLSGGADEKKILRKD
jgi:hypothetical protein